MRDSRGGALAELLVALAILGVGSAGTVALFTLADREMERAEIAQQAFLLASDLFRAGPVPGASPTLQVPGGALTGGMDARGIRVRFEPHVGEGDTTMPRHPRREWDFGVGG